MTREEAIEQLGELKFALSGTDEQFLDIVALDMAMKALVKEPCEDCISREWLKTAIHNFFYGLKHIPTEEDIQAYIDVAPSVTPQPKTGHWELYGNSWEDKFKCSECGKKQPKILCGERIIGHWSDYCPNCGTKMGVE